MNEAASEERFPGWDRNVRAPDPLPPEGACDCQFHIFGDRRKYPPVAGAWYEPPDATFEDMQRVLAAMHFRRGVIVYPMPYDTDTRLLVDVLRAMKGTPLAGNFRATCIVKDDVSDAHMAELDALGVVGARFNIGRKYGERFTRESVKRNLERVREIGWHARLHIAGPDLLELADLFLSVPDLTCSVDHMCHLDFSGGLEQPAMKLLLDLLRNENWWIMLSNGPRISKMTEGFDDAVPFGRTMLEAAPERAIWGTDWPHAKWRKPRMVNDAETVELFYRYADNDPELVRKVLVDNPARLHGFT